MVVITHHSSIFEAVAVLPILLLSIFQSNLIALSTRRMTGRATSTQPAVDQMRAVNRRRADYHCGRFQTRAFFHTRPHGYDQARAERE
jgi:hypothetical protein